MSDLDIPIDIHSSKLLDWLLSRKHVKPDWTINLGAIQTKINAAVSDIPRNTDIACLLSGAYIHYFHCKDIANVLAGTEDGARNVFGGYSSKRMNDWMEIIKMYERNNVFIAECARLLSTSVYFDVPALRKKIQKLEQMQQDVEKRESELLKTHSVLEADFKAECDVLGIKGKNIREELLAIVPELMNIYSGVVEALHSIEPAVEVYKRFKNKRNVKVGLDVVRHILEFGNTTVYQFIHCKEPKRVVLDKLPYEVAFDDSQTEEEIMFAYFNDKIEEKEFKIDLIAGDDANEIDQSSVAVGFEALSILDEPAHRDFFISDLLELQMFLKILLSNLTNPKDGKSGLMNLDAEVESEDFLSRMLLQVSTILELIDGTSAKKLHNMKHIPRYLEQLAIQLINKSAAIKRNEGKLEHCKFDIKQCYEDHKTANNNLKIIIRKTKHLQTQIEDSISKLYNNRPVNLIVNI